MTARLWWVRHGPTHARGMIGWTDLPADLSDEAAIGRLSASLPEGAPVISSDLDRARRTADAIAGSRPRLGDDRDLRELHFGGWERRLHDDIEAEDPGLARAFWERPGDLAPPGGESWNALSARVCAAADRLAARGGDIIVVAHFGAILSQVQRARAIPAQEAFAQHITPLSLTVTERGPAGRWTLRSVNEIK
ncbi:histidine phosphatase family protein [Profundibacterium mesophilum]|uniref:Phosphoglycerate mutase n=1 Tax=Profundibacterium mesophilum KAUST100406-0324 TaxID=1037889 RepID=A0A921TCU6_9RHOB|nr:histidine phosphatase family protein [Profundibacterium mesophilum]KAF0675342.1 phosphoglycerate mutase [Profundibacterium mesophilum KAUST100406-0324]